MPKHIYRPLSPHITIYKPQFSSIFSVFHRVTGIILTLGLLLATLSAKLIPSYAITYYPIYLMVFYLNTHWGWILAGIFSTLIPSLVYHFSNGIRHLLWDFSPETFLDKRKVGKSAYLILFLVVVAWWLFQ